MVNPSQNVNTAIPPAMAASAAKGAQAKNAPFSLAPAANTNSASTGGVEMANGAAKAADTKGGVAEAQDRFLKLLVTQMKNQDPLNPMDNAQVTSQMAQLSTVSGIDKVNSTLNALNGSMIQSQSMQAASMIGHVVMAPGSKIELKNGNGLAALELTQPADNVTVKITDSAGGLLRTLNLGSQKVGVVPLQWDGKNENGEEVADGNYKYSVIAKQGEEKVNVNTLAYGLVSGVMQRPDGAVLKVDQLGEVKMNSVKQIL